MRRSLFAALPPARFPDDVRLRSFLPGLDDDEWLALNSAAFVDLPDQGGWTLTTLAPGSTVDRAVAVEQDQVSEIHVAL